MPKKVLIVDDSMVARMAIKGALKECGAVLLEASSGEECLELLRSGSGPDMVFLDLTMPGIGGAETLKAIGTLPAPPKVVVVTADFQVQTLAELKALGAFEVQRKPAAPASIVEVFRRATGDGAE